MSTNGVGARCSVWTAKKVKTGAGMIAFILLCCGWISALAQSSVPLQDTVDQSQEDLAQQVKDLRQMVQKLQAQVDVLQRRVGPDDSSTPAEQLQTSEEALVQPGPPISTQVPQMQDVTSPASSVKAPDVLHGTTLNFLLDGYYEYNFNTPMGRDSLLRAYDVMSDAFSLNQAAIVLENAPSPNEGRRFGGRLDLQFGQATEALQGNSANEPRPDIYRNIFQAYGTYIFPVSKGLTIDVGKWASSLGVEGTYTKDQMNYSRSYWFTFLPSYHMGVRANYQLNDRLGFNYWITNGTQQTEPFNGYKDELFGVAMRPHKDVSWNVNYYLGQEHPDFEYIQNGPVNLPTLQGMPFAPISNPANGKLHIFDSYVTWNASPKFTIAFEGDYVIERQYSNSSPLHTDGGAGYIRYQLTPRFALAGRTEYMSDRGGLFSGVAQALKETTATAEYKLSNGLLIREEWRHDFSNRPYFLTESLGVLSSSQTTAGLGLVWWFGGKEGAW